MLHDELQAATAALERAREEVEAEADGLRRGEAELASLAVHESALAERPLRAAAQA